MQLMLDFGLDQVRSPHITGFGSTFPVIDFTKSD